jgi:hypothetical protein
MVMMGCKANSFILILLMFLFPFSAVVNGTSYSEIRLEEEIISYSNNNSNNSSSNPTNYSIVITSPTNNSTDHSLFYTSVFFEVSNYTGIIYWNATLDNGSGVISSNWTDYAYPNSTGQGQGQSLNSTVNYLLNGNISICVSLPSGEGDCITYTHYHLPYSIDINSSYENSTFSIATGQSLVMDNNGTLGSNYSYSMLSCTVLNTDYANNSTSFCGDLAFPTNSGIVTLRTYFYPVISGNYSMCISFSSLGNSSWNISECINFYVDVRLPSLSLHSPTNQSQIQTNTSTMEVNYSISNYSGSITWFANKSNQNQSNQWYTWVNSLSYGTNNTMAIKNTTIPILSESGNYSLCAMLDTGLIDCLTFNYVLPPTQVSIISPTNNSIISEPTYSWSQNTGYISIEASLTNYSGQLEWSVTSLDNSTQNGSLQIIYWNTHYHNSWSNTSIVQTNRDVGFGNKSICVSIPNQSGNQSNPYAVLSHCVIVEIIPRQVSIDMWIGSQQNTTNHSDNVQIHYTGNNYSNGRITINGNYLQYISAKFEAGNGTSHNHSNGTSHNHSSNYSTYYVNEYYLNNGNNTICVEVFGEDGSALSDCEIYFIPYPVIRINLITENGINFSHGHIQLSYYSENYTGTLYWNLVSANGENYSLTSYSSSYERSKVFHPPFFGQIEICASISTTSNQSANESVSQTNESFTQTCIDVELVPRMVSGYIVSPQNNTMVSNYFELQYYMRNVSSGSITINGALIENIYSNLDGIFWNNTDQNSSNYSMTNMSFEYGTSEICLTVVGEDGFEVTDCIVVTRPIPNLIASIISPSNNSVIVGPDVSVEFQLQNASNIHFEFNGQQYSILNNISEITAWSGLQVIDIPLGYGNGNLCLVSANLGNIVHSDCITISIVNPNLDSDSDGLADYIDDCPATQLGNPVDSQGCSDSQIDEDGDGVVNTDDICPNTQPQQTVNPSGCSSSQTDSDGDGISDLQDLCPNTNSTQVANSQGCSSSQIDSDNDGVMDNSDICPNTIVGSITDSVGCSSSQKDSDSDGVLDNFDQCPGTLPNTVIDTTGCPINPSSGSNASGGVQGEFEDEGMPGFEVKIVLMSILFALIALRRQG